MSDHNTLTLKGMEIKFWGLRKFCVRPQSVSWGFTGTMNGFEYVPPSNVKPRNNLVRGLPFTIPLFPNLWSYVLRLQ